MKKIVFFFALLFATAATAQNKASEGLKDKLLTADLGQGAKISGVLSVKEGAQSPSVLVVLLPGHPSIVKAEVEGDKVTKTALSGNFLIRARRQLINPQIATLIADCRQSNEIGDECPESYMASETRFADLDALIREAKVVLPSAKKVWLVGTSHGTVTSSHVPPVYFNRFAGVIHTSTVNYSTKYPTMSGVRYEEIKIPQLFVHHERDNCTVTLYSGIKSISEKSKIPLYTINGDKMRRDERISANQCDAFAAHGFKGVEVETMKVIQNAILQGIGASQKFEF